LYKPIYIGIGLASFLEIARYELPRPETKASQGVYTLLRDYLLVPSENSSTS
jgi:hypothetical protein